MKMLYTTGCCWNPLGKTIQTNGHTIGVEKEERHTAGLNISSTLETVKYTSHFLYSAKLMFIYTITIHNIIKVQKKSNKNILVSQRFFLHQNSMGNNEINIWNNSRV